MRIPTALITALAAQLIGQIIKVVVYSVRDRTLRLSYLTSAGGVPSAHTAFVTALTAYVGLSTGFLSDLFAISAVFAAIVVYDAFRLRGHVQRIAEAVNRLVVRPAGEDPLSEMIGHSIGEIAAGLGLGTVVALFSATVTIWR